MTVALPARLPVVGTAISATTPEELLDLLDERPPDRALVVAFCNVHAVMTARGDAALAAALRDADVAAPDGMPLVWMLRALGRRGQPRVRGPDFLRRALREGVARGWSQFFFGATEETLARLRTTAEQAAPGVDIAGWYAPPFRPLSPAEDEEIAAKIRAAGPALVWVGLGMPKQELWMHRMRERLPGMALLGVGAAFDLLAGNVREAPRWMQRTGLEWLFRLVQEPRRLWRRYLWNNPHFAARAVAQIVKKVLGTRY